MITVLLLIASFVLGLFALACAVVFEKDKSAIYAQMTLFIGVLALATSFAAGLVL